MNELDFNLLNWQSIALLMPILCTLLLAGSSLCHGIERRSLGWLFLFTLAASVTATPMIIGFAGAYDIWPNLTFIPTDFSLFFGPLLYYHGRSLMLQTPFQKTTLLWLVPGVIHLLYQITIFTAFDHYRSKWEYSKNWHDPFVTPFLLLIAATLAALAFIRVNDLRKNYLSWLSNLRSDEYQFDAIWFTHLSILTPALLIIWLIDIFSYRAFNLSYTTAFWFDLCCLLALFILVAETSNRINRKFPKMASELFSTPTNSLAEESKDWKIEGLRIQQLMLQEKWYLQQDLNLKLLARKVGSNQTYVSKAFNLGLGQSFSFLVNRMRIDYAQRLIDEGGFSLLEVSEVAGFGSKASFNRAFATHAKQTPSQYKAASQTLQNQETEPFS